LEPDEPGGGSDPCLLSLPELLLESPDAALSPNMDESHSPAPLTHNAVTAWLRAAGLRPCSWSFRLRISQTAYANWLKIPILTEHLLKTLTPQTRAERINAALASADRSSWRWEGWRGWTAWKDQTP
jgi:hypothetical protein